MWPFDHKFNFPNFVSPQSTSLGKLVKSEYRGSSSLFLQSHSGKKNDF